MRLIARSGPLADASIEVADGVAIGTGGGPRPACRISREGSGFVLNRLDRRVPIFVNGLPLRRRALQLRDEVLIGDSLFVVEQDARVAHPGSLPRPIPAETVGCGQTLLEVSFDEALLRADLDAGSAQERELTTLLRVSAALSSVSGLATIDAAVAALLLEVVRLERLGLASNDGGAWCVLSAWSTSVDGDPLRVDPALLARAAATGCAIVAAACSRHAIAAPMMAFGHTTGVVWAESASGARVEERDVRQLLAVAALVAVARVQARHTAALQQENERLQADINVEHNMVGRSRAMRAVFDRIARVARSGSTILLRGESGTGKELVARAVHRNSGRSERPFVAINCAALTESLLESELFGHEKGAFTGAVGLKRGKIEIAEGGTLFLDEIGELPLPLQAKLLRALQEREFERVGGTQSVRVDFRLIAATNRDLDRAVRERGFREDLFYRLNVITVTLPPLRDRPEDVPMLAEYFLRKHAPRCGRRVRGLDASAIERLSAHAWPGNVRELENVVEQALVLGAGEWITADDLPASVGASPAETDASSLTYHETIDRTKQDLIRRAFERCGQSHAGAARLLGVHPNYLHRLLRHYDMRAPRPPLRGTSDRSGK
jgi:transcriptional regulator with GAF, ATPase, and Fis domain